LFKRFLIFVTRILHELSKKACRGKSFLLYLHILKHHFDCIGSGGDF
jgi:hypothetical protein